MGQLTSGNIIKSIFKDMRNRYNLYVDKYKQLPKIIYTVKGGNNYVSLPYFDVMVQNFDEYSRVYKIEPSTIEITLRVKSFKTTPQPTPIPTGKICSPATTFMFQINNWTCGVFCLRMIGSRYGSIPDYQKVVDMAGSNPNNGTGHIGMRKVLLNMMGFKSAVSLYRNVLNLDQAREKIKEGYDVLINLKTGGMSGWVDYPGYPHWVLVQCIDNNYVWINDPDRGASIRHDRYTIEKCMDNNSNPDFIIAKK